MSQTLHPTKIDIADNTRAAMVGLLNARLADAVDLATQMKQAHWNVKGPSFIALHELFDAIHVAVQGHVDNLAERITVLGGTARGTAQVAAADSGLPAYPLEITAGADHVEAVSVCARNLRQGHPRRDRRGRRCRRRRHRRPLRRSLARHRQEPLAGRGPRPVGTLESSMLSGRSVFSPTRPRFHALSLSCPDSFRASCHAGRTRFALVDGRDKPDGVG